MENYPLFTTDGLLPPQDYELTIPQLKESILVKGKEGITSKSWDSQHRLRLVENAEIVIQNLWDIGTDEIYLAGSFVENKCKPADIDGYFNCPLDLKVKRKLETKLNEFNAHKIWTWRHQDRIEFQGKLRLPMWLKHRVELYPNFLDDPFPIPFGIQDAHGKDLTFPEALRLTRDGKPKGIIRILRE